ncbi:MAG: hypothetical protein GC206_11855 [Alphaproteobacteria bacterium]|nr:hypothetical protein [Alphaproteobacteria bacterium]
MEPSIVSPSRPRFSRTWKFWAYSALIGLVIGGIVYVSPEGQRGEGFGFVGRANALLFSTLFAFAFSALARSLLHLSGRLVGKESAAYFSKEFLVLLGVSGALSALLGLSAGGELEGATSSFLFGFASSAVVLIPLFALAVAMFRVMRRMLFPRT